MNKNEAMARLDAIEREAKELRRIIEAPKYSPDSLVGKLCRVWDGDYNMCHYGVIDKVNPSCTFVFYVAHVGWMHAEPLNSEEIESIIYEAKHD